MVLVSQKSRKTQEPIDVVILQPVRVNTPGEGARTLFPPDPKKDREKTVTLPAVTAHLLISQRQARLPAKAAAQAEAQSQPLSELEEDATLELIESVEDIDVLRRWIGEEEDGDAREAVLEALDERGAELYRRLKAGAAGGDDETPADEEEGDGDPLEGVQFASETAEKEAREAELSAGSFDGVAASGEGGYTAADVRGVIEKASG